MDQDAQQVAHDAGLRYVSDSAPGIRRVRQGRGFAYVNSEGRRLHDEAELRRIKSLAVPPAYQNVWICAHHNGHIQATAVDARGRKQYRYHPKWREVRDETKFHRLIGFGQSLPRARRSIETDLALEGLPREKVLAAVVRLLEETTIRVGNDEYAKTNDSYGLTTMQNRHAKVQGASVRFNFTGKSGIKHAVALRDRRLAKIIRACQDLPGQDLFAYVDEDRTTHTVSSHDVNEYIRDISGGDFTAKDFRTWVGSLECLAHLCEHEPVETLAERKHVLNEAVSHVARHLGNTPAVARKSYIHPAIVTVFLNDGRIKQNSLLAFLKANEV